MCVLLKTDEMLLECKYFCEICLSLKMPSPIFRYFHPKISLFELFGITNATNLLFIFTNGVNVRATQVNFVFTSFLITDYLEVV